MMGLGAEGISHGRNGVRKAIYVSMSLVVTLGSGAKGSGRPQRASIRLIQQDGN